MAAVSSKGPLGVLGSELTQGEIRQYSRQLILEEVGVMGQRTLKGARVLVVGTGGLGAPVLLYLAAAGVGTLGIVEFDLVDQSNLHRQVLFGTDDIGKPKLDVACERIHKLNPYVQVETYDRRLTVDNALDIISAYDVVVDTTDNFPTRYLINDSCVLLGKPNVSASIFRFEGQLSVFWPGRGPCYRCVYPEPPPPELAPSCAEGGVLGVLPGMLGTLQANETIKLLLGKGDSLVGRLLSVDALASRFDTFNIARDPDCRICSPQAKNRGLLAYDMLCSAHPGMLDTEAVPEISAHELDELRGDGTSILLVDVRNPTEYELTRIPGALLLPLTELSMRLDELSKDRKIVCYCHTGKRSARAVALLQDSGFTGVTSLAGGIEAWSTQIDASVPHY
ncbi:MAG: molybdopterin-synthase adenylyltransferase MoeB [Rhodanobacter sp.]